MCIRDSAYPSLRLGTLRSRPSQWQMLLARELQRPENGDSVGWDVYKRQGKDSLEAVQNSIVLEEVAKMSYFTLELNPHAVMPEEIIKVRYLRKHGAQAYYGQSITL